MRFFEDVYYEKQIEVTDIPPLFFTSLTILCVPPFHYILKLLGTSYTISNAVSYTLLKIAFFEI